MSEISRPSSDQASRQPLGRVILVNGSQCSVALATGVERSGDAAQITVGKFICIVNGPNLIIGLVTEIEEQPSGAQQFRSVACRRRRNQRRPIPRRSVPACCVSRSKAPVFMRSRPDPFTARQITHRARRLLRRRAFRRNSASLFPRRQIGQRRHSSRALRSLSG
jgi:hypothetical protein